MPWGTLGAFKGISKCPRDNLHFPDEEGLIENGEGRAVFGNYR